MDDLAERIGFLLVLAFLWFCWPPLVLLGAGVLLIAWANTRTRSGQIGAAVGAAVAAAKATYTASVAEVREQRTRELRPVA